MRTDTRPLCYSNLQEQIDRPKAGHERLTRASTSAYQLRCLVLQGGQRMCITSLCRII